VRQRWALRQHSCKPLSILFLHVTLRQLECADAAPAVINGSSLKTNWRFSATVPLRASHQKLLLKRTTAGRRILSTTSLALFEVLLSMIVLAAAQVLHQSSGMACRAAAKRASAAMGSRHFFEAHGLSVRLDRRMHLAFGRCRVSTCSNTPLVVGLRASILRRLLASGLAARHSQVCLGRLPTPAGMGLGESPRSRTR
jgi:hypothetical protein